MLIIVIAVPQEILHHVPVVVLDISYMIMNVLLNAQTTIMETTENVIHVTTGAQLVLDPTMETPVLVMIHTILIQMD